MVRDITIIIVKSAKGEYYINKRVLTKSYAPGLYSFGAGGKVEPTEIAIEGAIRELKEELGIIRTPEQIKHLFSFPFDSGSGQKTRHIYLLEHEGPFQPTPKEFIIEETGWREEKEVDKLDLKGKLCPDTSIAWRKYKELRQA